MRVVSRVVLLEPAQVQTCNVVPARSRAGEGPRQVVRFWTSAGPDLRGGFPPDSGREPGFLRRKPEERAPGAAPPGPPSFMARSLALARFGGGVALLRSRGYYEPHVRALIWKLSFSKMLFSIFFPENASQIGFSIPVVIAPQPYQNQQSQKPASGNERP